MEILIVPFYGILLRVIRSRRMGVAGHVANTGRRMFTKEKTTWKNLDVNGKTKLHWTLRKLDGSVWSGLIGSRIWMIDVLL